MPYIRSATATERVHVLILDVVREPITGASLVIKVWRSSDGKLLDFADLTFKTSGHSSITTALTEHSASNNPGVYYVDVPISAITNANADDVYTFRIDQSSGTTAVNLPAIGEVRVGRWVDTIGTNLDVAVSSRATDAGAASSVWGTSVPGAFGSGTAGYNLDVAVSTRAATGAAMTLANDSITAAVVATSAVTEIQSGLATASAVAAVAGEVWGVALPGAYGAGTAGANLGVAVSTRAVAGDAMTLAANAVNAAAIANDAVAEIQNGLATAVALASIASDVQAVPAAVWDIATSAHTTLGTFGEFLSVRLDASVSTRATPGAAMTLEPNAVTAAALANDAVAEIGQGVWGVALPGSFGAGTAGANLGVAVSTRAVAGDAMTLAANSINATAVASDAVAEIQSGLATAAALSSLSTSLTSIPGAVWDELLSAHTTSATFGAFLALQLDVATSTRAAPGATMALVSSAITSSTLAASAITAIQSGLATASSVSAVPAAVWNVAQSGYSSDATTFGWALRTLRMMATNRIKETPGSPGTLVVYADDGTSPFLTYNLTDFNGNLVIGMVGAPARRAAATVTP